MSLKLGLNLGYWGIGPAGEDAVGVVQAAEAAGFESVWAAESYGSAVVSGPAWLARPAEARAAPFLCGSAPRALGVPWGWDGAPSAKRWAGTREYVEVVREIVAREGKLD